MGRVSYGIYKSLGAGSGWSCRRWGGRPPSSTISRGAGPEPAELMPATTDPGYPARGPPDRGRGDSVGHRHAGHRGHPAAVRVRWTDVSDRQRRSGDHAADAGRPDRALAGLVARRPAVRLYPARAGRGVVAGAAVAGGAGRAGAGDGGGAQHHAGVLARRPAAGLPHSDETGTDIYSQHRRSLLRATLDRGTLRGQLISNVFTRWPPDRVRSTRAGPPQIYVMAADGTDQELLAPFDYGATGSSNAPEWSPDGANVVFHREVTGSPQIFLVDAAGRRVRQPRRPAVTRTRPGGLTAATSHSSPTGAVPPALGHRCRNRPRAPAADAWRGAAPCVVPPPESDRGRPLTSNVES